MHPGKDFLQAELITARIYLRRTEFGRASTCTDEMAPAPASLLDSTATQIVALCKPAGCKPCLALSHDGQIHGVSSVPILSLFRARLSLLFPTRSLFLPC